MDAGPQHGQPETQASACGPWSVDLGSEKTQMEAPVLELLRVLSTSLISHTPKPQFPQLHMGREGEMEAKSVNLELSNPTTLPCKSSRPISPVRAAWTTALTKGGNLRRTRERWPWVTAHGSQHGIQFSELCTESKKNTEDVRCQMGRRYTGVIPL